MMQKYTTLKQEFFLPDGRKVKRIKALRDFGNIKAGTVGGFIDDWHNLSHRGNCWIADDAIAVGNSKVSENALLAGKAFISHRVMLGGNAVVWDEAVLLEHVFVYGSALIGEKTVISGVATVCGNAVVLCRPRFKDHTKRQVPNIRDNAFITGGARLEGSITVRDDAHVGGRSIIRGNARIIEQARIEGEAIIENLATVGERAWILQKARIGGRSKIMGRAAVFGQAVVIGKSYVTCSAQVGGHSIIESETLGGDTVRIVRKHHEYGNNNAVETLPTRGG